MELPSFLICIIVANSVEIVWCMIKF